jgi:hypothetical protein
LRSPEVDSDLRIIEDMQENLARERRQLRRVLTLKLETDLSFGYPMRWFFIIAFTCISLIANDLDLTPLMPS